MSAKLQFGISVILYTLAYAVRSFIIWDFRNPFQWVLDIPIYSNDTRGMILFFWVIYQAILILAVTEFLKKDKTD